jgi:hypothetical protein
MGASSVFKEREEEATVCATSLPWEVEILMKTICVVRVSGEESVGDSLEMSQSADSG